MMRILKGITVNSALCLCALAACVGQNPPQQKSTQPQEDVIKIYTDLAQTDVMVFDKQGRFVNNLRREDFQLHIDGEPQPIEFFEQISAGSANEEAQLAAARGTATSVLSAPAPLDRGRTILFYVDDFHLSAGDLIFLRQALQHFIDNDLGQNDEAVITSASGQIGFLQQLTENKFVLRRAVERINARPQNTVRDAEQPPMNEYQALVIDRQPAAMELESARVTDPNTLLGYFVLKTMEGNQDATREGIRAAVEHVRDRARAILQQAAGITTNSLAAFEGIVRSAANLPGHKLVFFISDGFYVDPRNSEAYERLNQITRSAARNGVVIYSMDTRALTANTPLPGEEGDTKYPIVDRERHNELLVSREGMSKLANDTGGRTIFDTNALDTGLATALKETSVYYLLGWRLNHDDQVARYAHHVDVALVNHPEATVRLRQVSLAETAAVRSIDPNGLKESEKPPAAQLTGAVSKMFVTNQLPVALDLRYTSTAKGPLLTITVEGEIDTLGFASINGKQKALVDLGGWVYDDQGRTGANFLQQVSIVPASETGPRLQGKLFSYRHEVALSPGLYQVRAAARDEQSGKVGTVYQWILIPDLSKHELTMSSIIAGEVSASGANPTQNEPTASRMTQRADHRFHRDASLRFFAYLYNASVAGDAKPDAALQVQIFRDRQPVLTTPLQTVRATDPQSGNQLPCGGTVSLAGLSRGHYLLVVTAIDRVSKTSASQEMRFDIE